MKDNRMKRKKQTKQKWAPEEDGKKKREKEKKE